MSFFDSDDDIDNSQINLTIRAVEEKSAFSEPYEEQLFKTAKAVNESLGKVNLYQQDLELNTKGPLKRQIEVVDPNFEEQLGLFNLVKSADKEFQGTIVAFTHLDHQVNKIIQKFEQCYMNPLVTYGLTIDFDPSAEGDGITSTGVRELRISRMFPLFKDVFDLLKRTSFIMINIVNQLHVLYYAKDKFFKEGYKYFDLFTVLETLGKACSVIYTIDLILKETPAIKEDFNRLKTSIRLMYKEPSRFGTNEAELRRLEKNISKYDRTILSGACFVGTVSQKFDQGLGPFFAAVGSAKPVKDNAELNTVFMNYFKLILDRSIELVGSSSETFERKNLYGVFCLYGLYRRLFPQNEDRKLWKQLWSVQKKIPIIVVGSHLVFTISHYMKVVVELTRKSKKGKDPIDAEAFLADYIDKKQDTFEKEMHGYYTQFVGWAAQMDSNYGKSAPAMDPKGVSHAHTAKARLLLTGVVLACQIKQNLVSFVFLHVKQGLAMSTAVAKWIVTGSALLKAIKYLVEQNEEGFPSQSMTDHAYKYLEHKIKQIKELVNKITRPKKELVQAILMLERLFDGPPSSLRKSAQLACLNYLDYRKERFFKGTELDDFKYYVWKAQLLGNYQIVFKDLTDCTFLYWIKDIVPILFSHVGANPIEMKRLKFFTVALQDCEIQIKSVMHLEDKMELFEAYKKELHTHLQGSLIKVICQEIDDHLRLLMHAMLIEKLKGRNPFEIAHKPLHQYLINGPIEIFGIVTSPVEEVSKHLNETFYNLNVLNLHDYETYEGLRNLAKELFRVDLLPVYLPSQGLEKGNVDILQIMRNLTAFVNNYNYNMFTQTFLEARKESTIINSVSINQISDSMHTHGVGILNTTANLVYQFILKKFNTFSQFLFDDLVQTPLRREQRTFKENKEHWDGRYQYARVELLTKEIKRLGLFEDGRTFLDKFRGLITTVGNALGFVRLLRSASLSYLSKQIEFLPYSISCEEDVEINEDFYLELVRFANLSGVCCGAATSLDDVIKTLKISFSNKTDYLRILTKAFDDMLASAGAAIKHLRLFYFLVPSLMMNYIDAMLNMKEKIAKKRAPDAFIFDDGFPLGLAYFLHVLGQHRRFDSLHWFEEFKKKIDKDMNVLKEMREREEEQVKNMKKKGKDGKVPVEVEEDNDADFNIQMSVKKTTQLHDEFTNFCNTFITAKILMREVTTQDE